jgi:alpha-L-fucosidase
VIHWLIDTVSKNGTFILNIPGRPDGTIDSKEVAVLDGVTSWMQINGEAIYETRPWKIYGEGPNSVKAGAFGGNSVNKLGAKDIRFTRNKPMAMRWSSYTSVGARERRYAACAGSSAFTFGPGRAARCDLRSRARTSSRRLRWRSVSAADSP